jgi:twitching motility two-component system response regulator PilH
MTKARVLVVDDQESARLKLEEILDNNGYRVKTAKSGPQCLEMVKSNTDFDLIFLDIVMDEMDGFKTCRLLAKNNSTKDIPVIMVSANNNKVDKLWAHKQGARAYICKPYSEEEIIQHIERYV